MIRRLLSASLIAGVTTLGLPALVAPVHAAAAKKAAKATTGKPADATAQCDDGTYSKAKTKQGACSSHGGVKTWYADEATSSTSPASPAPKTTAVRAPRPARTSTPATPAPPATATEPTTTKPTTTAPPAGAEANATAKCKDGTYSHAKQHSGACSHHGGVAEWYK
jgi:uncharacterized protein with FMN-binding domain